MFTQLALQFNRNPQLDDDEGFEQAPTAKCPFDSSHIMQPKNLITHINRCKSPNKHLYVQCRYDPCHWIYPQQLQRHYQQCPTRKQYYADLDLNEGDWNQQEMMIKIEQKIQKEKLNKRKRKLVKIITILKLKKKLKKASTKQEYQHLQKTLTKELSCFKSKSKNVEKKQQKLYETQLTIKNQTSQFLFSANMIKKPNNQFNFQSKLPPKNLNFSETPRYDNLHTQRQYTYLPPNPIPQYSQNLYQPLIPQFQYHQQSNFQMHTQSIFKMQYPSNFNHHSNNLYWQPFQNQYSPMIIKKPLPEKGLKFSQIADTQQFIKKKHKQNFTQKQNISLFHSPENLSNSYAYNLYAKNYPVNSHSQVFETFTNYNGEQYYNKQTYNKNHQVIDNYAFMNQKNNVYLRKTDNQRREKQYRVNQKANIKQKQIKNEQNLDEYGQNTKTDKKKKDKQSSNKKNKKDKKGNQQKYQSSSAGTRTQKVFNNKRDSKNYKQDEVNYKKGQKKQIYFRDEKSQINNKVLNSSISEYDFIPFDVHPILNSTIMDSLLQNEEQSQFLQMKQMLEVLQQKNKK